MEKTTSVFWVDLGIGCAAEGGFHCRVLGGD